MRVMAALARFMDRPDFPGWVTYGPDGKPHAWYLFEWLAERHERSCEHCHDRERCGVGWLP